MICNKYTIQHKIYENKKKFTQLFQKLTENIIGYCVLCCLVNSKALIALRMVDRSKGSKKRAILKRP